jgi:single-strand DNA-binding protein
VRPAVRADFRRPGRPGFEGCPWNLRVEPDRAQIIGRDDERKGSQGKASPLRSAIMASLNKVMLIGNLTRDPEVRYTPKGMAVTDIGIAVNRVFSASDGGEKREETTFVDVTLWGRQAEIAGQYLQKGRPVFIEGRLQLDSWEDKTSGQKRSKLKVVGENMQFLGGARDGGGGSGGGGGGGDYGGGQQSAPAEPSHEGGGSSGGPPSDAGEEDDIPF